MYIDNIIKWRFNQVLNITLDNFIPITIEGNFKTYVTTTGESVYAKRCHGKVITNVPLINGCKLTVPLANLVYFNTVDKTASTKDIKDTTLDYKDGNPLNLTYSNLVVVTKPTKICSDCNVNKSLNDYSVSSRYSDNRHTRCRVCDGIRSSNYHKTEVGVISRIYAKQKQRQRTRNHGTLPYTQSELSKWLYANGFKELYDAWVKSNYSKETKPSVDRLDSLRGYSFDNIELVTWDINNRRGYDDRIKGLGSTGKTCKVVLQYKDDVLIKRYVSRSDASRIMGYSVQGPLTRCSPCKNGFTWRYE